MSHLVLLGDSILDNAAYVAGCSAVIDQVRQVMPAEWKVTLSAVDGSVINDVARQLQQLPADATHLVLSCGGNDVLGAIEILHERVRTVGEALLFLAQVRDRLHHDYRAVLEAIRRRKLPATLCTIYNPCFPDEQLQRAAVAALGLFNDRIIGLARESGFPVIELRAICTDSADFANAIEPSAIGGGKIADAIARVVTGHEFGARRAVLFP
jgi:hypothetical protein